MRRIQYKGYNILETSDAEFDEGRGPRWKVDTSRIAARGGAEMPSFYQLPAAKAFIREELLEEHPFNDDDGGGS